MEGGARAAMDRAHAATPRAKAATMLLTRCCHRGHRERRDRRQLVRDDPRTDEAGQHSVGGRCGLLLIIAWSNVQRSAINHAAKRGFSSVGWYEPSYGLSKC